VSKDQPKRLLQDDIDELNRCLDNFFLEVRNQLLDYKRKFYHLRDVVYMKIKHSLGVKEMQKLPNWFFFTVHFSFMPVWTIRSIKESLRKFYYMR
jgi:hypothetical protein